MSYDVRIKPVVHGVTVDGQTRCAHWHSTLDIIALSFKCCRKYYACHTCHLAVADHEPERWRMDEDVEELAVLCGACGTQLSAQDYLRRSDDECPNCKAAWNPGCRLHTDLYFDIANSWRALPPEKAEAESHDELY